MDGVRGWNSELRVAGVATSTVGLNNPSYSATASTQKALTSEVQSCTALSCSFLSAATGAISWKSAGSEGALQRPLCRLLIRLQRIDSARLVRA